MQKDVSKLDQFAPANIFCEWVAKKTTVAAKLRQTERSCLGQENNIFQLIIAANLLSILKRHWTAENNNDDFIMEHKF